MVRVQVDVYHQLLGRNLTFTLSGRPREGRTADYRHQPIRAGTALSRSYTVSLSIKLLPFLMK
jgi:hypothetical protein